MQLINKFNKVFRILLCVINIYTKYTWVIRLKDKKRITISSVFQKNLDKSKREPNKTWIDKGSQFYNKLMKTWLEKNDIEIGST